MSEMVEPGSQGGWQRLADIYSLPYWQRLWIVQEICLASRIEVLYGNDTCHWDDLVNSIEHVDKDHRDWNHRLIPSILKEEAQSISQSPARKLALTRAKENSAQKGQNTHKLWALIALCKDSKCHDPRDKVYGLLGIANDVEKTRS